MSIWFHDGEMEIQAQAGVRAIAERVAESIDDRIPPAAVPFLSGQRFALLGAESPAGVVFATLLAGPAGFLQTDEDETHLHILDGVLPNDPLADALTPGRPVGLQAIDPQSRRRMRLNGRVARFDGEVLDVALREVYANCPKYIQAREFSDADRTPTPARVGSALDAAQIAQLSVADTFYIATLHAERGADISHRGGMPGFVRVDGETKLSWPDYSGNNMFQTLGNLRIDPHAGLLFIDWSTGDMLHVSGRASVDWDASRSSEFPGAQRMIDFEIERVVERGSTFPMSATLIDYSQYNPTPD